MIKVTTTTDTIIEEDMEFTLKKYDIETSYPSTQISVNIDELENRLYTDIDGGASISISGNKKHDIIISIDDEVLEKKL